MGSKDSEEERNRRFEIGGMRFDVRGIL